MPAGLLLYVAALGVPHAPEPSVSYEFCNTPDAHDGGAVTWQALHAHAAALAVGPST